MLLLLIGIYPLSANVHMLEKVNISVTDVNSWNGCGSPPGVMMADTLSFNAKIGVVDF